MKLILIILVLLLITTLKPKYLGKLGVLSLEKFTTCANTKTIQCIILLSFIFSLIYIIFKPQIDSLWMKRVEGFGHLFPSIVIPPAARAAAAKAAAAKAAAAEKAAVPLPPIVLSPAAASNTINKLDKNTENAPTNPYILMAKGDKFSEMLRYDQAIETYKNAIDVATTNNVKFDDKLVIQLHQKIATVYRDKASSFKCDKITDPESGNCKKADEALEKAKEYRNKTLNDICDKNSDSELCKKARESGSSPMDAIGDEESPSPSENISDYIQHTTLTKGVTVDNVTPSPVYYEPGTVKYSGLGYTPSYSDINYMNNKFITKPEIVNQFNKKGFCDLSDNIMENIDKKCEKLPKGICAATSCCVLVGDQKCVQGDEQGPKNKAIYSDTTIKNREVYYYQGKCYGNCA